MMEIWSMSNSDYLWVAGIAVVIILGVVAASNLMLAGLICWVSYGFGYELPYWPVLGALFIGQVFLSGFKVALGKGD